MVYSAEEPPAPDRSMIHSHAPSEVIQPNTSSLAQRFPDTPRWIEVRDQLLRGESALIGFEDAPEPSFVIRDDDGASAFVVGRPALAAVREAIAGEMHGGIVVPQEETAAWLEHALPEWRRMPIALYLLHPPEHLPVDVEERVRFLDPASLPDLALPADLLEELLVGAERSPIAAAFADGAPVSFCYAGWTSETLWDVSIDTLEEHRRRGYAGLVAAHMIRYMRGIGKEPVWAALRENVASWRLALGLGFDEVDEIALFERR